MTNDAQMPDVRRWDYYPIEMPLTADGKGPATVGVDAARIAYEVWDRDLSSHASYDNLPDAINEAMRLNAALPSDPAADLCASGQQVRALADLVRSHDCPTPKDHSKGRVLWNVIDMPGEYRGQIALTIYEAEQLGHILAALTPAPQPAGEAVIVSQDALIDLIGEFGREVCYMLDDCETSGPVGEEVHTITDESLTKVSAILDRIDALPFEEPGVILGTGAMLQAAIKQTFQTHPPQPSETVAEAATHALDACRIIDAAVLEGHDNVSDLICHLLEAVEPARAALRALKEAERNALAAPCR